jgi:IS5 family transposase
MATAETNLDNERRWRFPPDSINRRYGRNRRRFSRGTRQTSKWHGPCYNHKQHFVFKQNIERMMLLKNIAVQELPWLC